LSIVQGPFSVGRAKPPIVRFATFAGTTIRPLWGTAQLFKHQRFMNGGATSPQAEVYAFAAAQVGVKWKAEVESTTLYAGCVS
jgi:xylose isomerase